MDYPFHEIFYYLVLVLDLIGILVAAWGSVQALVSFIIIELFKESSKETKFLEKLRAHFGQKLLLALEFFVAADLVKVVLSPSFKTLGKLGAIVLIRVVLSFFLNREIRDIRDKWGAKVWKEQPKESKMLK